MMVTHPGTNWDQHGVTVFMRQMMLPAYHYAKAPTNVAVSNRKGASHSFCAVAGLCSHVPVYIMFCIHEYLIVSHQVCTC